MKKTIKKCLASMIAIVMLMTSNVMPVNATVTENLTYEIVSGAAYITGCNKTISGELIIPETIDEYVVKGISIYAFAGCTELTGVVIPSGVTNIGDYAFAECLKISTISIPTSVTSIGTHAFLNCKQLREVSIPVGVTTISNSIFKGCNSLEELVIPSGVTSIAASAFEGCSSLASINIPSSVTNIGNRAFYNCNSLTDITIPLGVTSINEAIFYGCDALKSVSVPTTVTSIGASAFSGCSGLTQIDIPSGVTSIGAAAFDGCSGIKEITIPAGVTQIENSTFNGCNSLESLSLSANLKTVGNYAFCGCKSLTGVLIPEGVTSIGSYAFSYCDNLVEVSLPSTIITIENGAFINASQLQNITIPTGVTKIGNLAFGGCESLTQLVLPETISTLGAEAFTLCKNLQTINIPSQITVIENSLFCGCSSLKEISIPTGVTTIGNLAFAQCEELKEVNIPYGVNSIGDGAFQTCTNLNKIVIPYGVDSIGESVFAASPSVVIYTTAENVKEYAVWNQIDYVWQVNELYIEQLPSKVEYDLHEPLLMQGFVLKSVCDGEVIEVAEGYEVSGFDSSNAGVCTLTVEYGGQCVTFDVTIHDYSEWKEVISPTYTTEGEKERVCDVCGKKETAVIDKNVLTEISLNRNNVSIVEEGTFQLVLDGVPSAPISSEIVWSSSNSSVAIVDENGLVTGKSQGRAMITATVGEMYAKCEVIVCPTLKLSSVTLRLENDITVIFKAKASEINMNYMEPYVVVTQEIENGQTKAQEIYGNISSDGEYYEFKYAGVNAKEITDNLEATIYAYDDYGLIQGKTITDYSVMLYCKNQLEKTSSELNFSEEKTLALKSLLVDLVNCASEAQIYFDYKSDALAWDLLSEEQKMWASDESALENLQKVTNACYETVENPSVKWNSVALLLEAKTVVRVKITYDGNINDIKLYAKVGGNKTYLVEDYKANGNGTYYFFFDKMTAYEFGSTIDFYFMEGTNVISNTLRYSVESYVANKIEDVTIGPVVKALMKYGKSAVKFNEL